MKKIVTLVLTTIITLSCLAQVRISQVYGAGGNSGATYNQDFVELYNAGASTVSLDGWSLQYASATGPGGTGAWAVDSFVTGSSIGAGQYFLVALGSGATGAALPTPDNTNTSINMASTAGKVALVSSQTPLNGTTACSDGTVLDVIGYGATATCYEGVAANTSGLTSTEALFRRDNGCIDFNNNNVDFLVAPVAPRNSSTPANSCTNAPLVITTDVSGLLTVTGTASAAGSFNIYAINLSGGPGNLTVVPSSTDIEISTNSAGPFASAPLNVPYASAAPVSTTIYARIAGTAPLGAVNEDVVVAGGGSTGDTANITGNVLVAEPTTQATNIVTSNITDTSMTINWTNGNGGNRIVVMHAASSPTVTPADSRSYGSSLDYRLAPSIGSGNNVVFNTTGSGPINVIGLTAGITYTISVYEYDSAGTGTHNYLTTTATNNPVTAATTGISSNLTQLNFTALAAPLYMGNGTATRTPTLYYAKVSNLAPNTTYRYFTQAAVSTDIGAAVGGAGNPILFDYTVSPVTYTYTSSASLATAGGYGKFTTDADGNFQGTFGFVNTGNTRFTAGNALMPSITLAADPATVAQFRFALNQTITALTFSSSAGATNGTFLQGNSLAIAGNLVAIWDNVNATGRPLAMTLAENPTFAGSVVWGTSFIPGYSTTTGSWNTIIPNDNANGVRLIQQFDIITGDVIGCDSDADGVWPTGNVNTVNPTGGVTPLLISVSDAPLNGGNCFNVVPVKLETINAYKVNTGIALDWKLTCLSSGITMEVQRSADTRNFSTIESITATQARCAEPFNYLDAAPLRGRNFYRLKMTDADGRVSYSPVVLVMNSGGGGLEFVGLYPSATHDKTMLSISSDRQAIIEVAITDMSGRIISKGKHTITAGSSLIPVDCTKLAAGMYNVTAITENTVGTTLRLVKL
jgi:hypothetical protein